MTRLTAISLAVLFLASCISSDRNSMPLQTYDSEKVDTIGRVIIGPQGNTTLKLDYFKSIPDTIDGCGEFFTLSTNELSGDNYVFLSNLAEFAVIKIDGKEIYLNKDTIESKEIDDRGYVAVYKGKGYTAVLTVKKAKDYDEGGYYSGSLQIIGDKKTSTYKVHGEVGC